MRNLDVAAVDMAISEAANPEDCAGVHLDSIAERDVGVKHRVGMHDAITSQPTAISNNHPGYSRVPSAIVAPSPT